MNNPEPTVGDIWLWCRRSYILVLDWIEDEGCWRALNINSGAIGLWTLAVNDEVEGIDWEFVT